MDSTVLIIGAGTFGTSTAWHLSQNHNDPSKVTIIDREASPPSLSAAADINRIFTSDYASPLYAELAKEAFSFWTEDPDLEWYFHKTGRLVLDDGDNDHGFQTVGRGHATSTHTIPVDEVSKRWKLLRDTDTRAFVAAYLDTEAGWIESATATWQFLETAVRRRVKREVGDVTELLVDVSSRTIRGAKTSDGRTFLADTVVLAAGAWTSALLAPVEDALQLADEDRIEHQAQANSTISVSYPMSPEIIKDMNSCKLPCIAYGSHGEVVPASRDNKLLRYTDLGIRIVNSVTTKSGRSISVPPRGRGQSDVPRELKAHMQRTLTSKLMPRLSDGVPKWRMCWDNVTPTGDLLLCEHPRIKDLFIVSGGSFNGYKFMPNIGKYMINVLKRQSNGETKDQAWAWKTPDELAAVARGKLRVFDLSSVDTTAKTARL